MLNLTSSPESGASIGPDPSRGPPTWAGNRLTSFPARPPQTEHTSLQPHDMPLIAHTEISTRITSKSPSGLYPLSSGEPTMDPRSSGEPPGLTTYPPSEPLADPGGVRSEISGHRGPHVVMEKDSQEVHQELSRLKTRIGEVRTTVASMPGIDTNPEEQQKRLKHLEEQVQNKQQLLHKYKSLGVFEIPK
uniref:Mediator of RNA polymerase II transcription subunit 9 n=1 Tax=Eptatretus burgeri TaxID=7764 RepID=A0A8C4NF84_EPTBU